MDERGWGEGPDTLALLGAARSMWPRRWGAAALYYFDETGSTNDEALRLAGNGEPEGTAVVARRQTAGRGRRGRAWASHEGGLWISALVDAPRRQPGRIAIAAGVAAAEAVEGCCGVACGLKWPNDLMVEGKKVGGVLIEAGDRSALAVVGMGLNCNQPPDDLGAAHQGLRETATTLQAACGRPVALHELTGGLMQELDRRLGQAGGEGWHRVLEEWTRRDILRGRRVMVNGEGKTLTGVCAGVDESGALLVGSGRDARRVVSADQVRVIEAEGA